MTSMSHVIAPRDCRRAGEEDCGVKRLRRLPSIMLLTRLFYVLFSDHETNFSAQSASPNHFR